MIHAPDCSTTVGDRLCNCRLSKWCYTCKGFVSPLDYELDHKQHQAVCPVCGEVWTLGHDPETCGDV